MQPETSGVTAGLARADLQRRWSLAMPALVVIGAFSILPLMMVVVYSVLASGSYGGVQWHLSWEGWFSVFFERDIFDDSISVASAHVEVLLRSVLLALATMGLTLVFGLPTAWFIATRAPQTRGVWLFLITIPFWTNLLVRTIAIQDIIRADGVVNRLLIWAGMIEAPLPMMFTNGAVLLGMTYVYLPLMVLPVFAAIEKFDFRLAEAAYDLYASRLFCLRRVILPMVRPGIAAGAILVFIPALGAYVTPRLMGGGTAMMWGNLIDLQFGQGRNWPLGAALSVALTVLILVALVWYLRQASQKAAAHG